MIVAFMFVEILLKVRDKTSVKKHTTGGFTVTKVFVIASSCLQCIHFYERKICACSKLEW